MSYRKKRSQRSGTCQTFRTFHAEHFDIFVCLVSMCFLIKIINLKCKPNSYNVGAPGVLKQLQHVFLIIFDMVKPRFQCCLIICLFVVDNC